MKKFLTSTTIFKYLTFLGIISLMPLVLAKIPNASEIVNIKGKKVMFQQGKQRRSKAQVGQRLENKNQKLIVSGNKNDLARLIFLEADDFYSGLLLQAGPNSQETQYQFPCTLENGKLTIGWRQGQNRGCEEGIYLSPTTNNDKDHLKNLFAQVPKNQKDAIIIKPAQKEKTLVQIYTEENQQTVTPLIEDIILVSPNHPNGLKIEVGKQWSYNSVTNQESINSIDQQSILDSPELEDFLRPENWSSDSLSRTVNSDVKEHITALASPTENDLPIVNIFCQNKVNIYLSNLKTTLNDTWSPPKPPNRGVWKTLLNYRITKNGQVQNPKVIESSGHEPLDQAAIDHVYSLEQNFSPFPSCYPGNSLPVDHSFRVLFF